MEKESKFENSIENTINVISIANSIFGTKQETLEEYQEALKQFPEYDQYLERIGFEAGAKWQQERSYSEEEIYNLIQAGYSFCEKGKNREDVKKWFEQHKKK